MGRSRRFFPVALFYLPFSQNHVRKRAEVREFMLQDGSLVVAVPCDEIQPFERQPRQYFDKERFKEFKANIKKYGQQIPGLLKRLHRGSARKYELVEGQRRWQALSELGKPFLAIIEDNMDFQRQYLLAIRAGNGQLPYSILDTFNAVCMLRDEFKFPLKEIAESFSRSEQWVEQYLKLKAIENKLLLTLADPERRPRISLAKLCELARYNHDIQYRRASLPTLQTMPVSVLKAELAKIPKPIQVKGRLHMPLHAQYQQFEYFIKYAAQKARHFVEDHERGKFLEILRQGKVQQLPILVSEVSEAIDNLGKIKEILESRLGGTRKVVIR